MHSVADVVDQVGGQSVTKMYCGKAAGQIEWSFGKFGLSQWHSLTHSLVDLRRWGLATADDHSDIFLLHCAWSCDISFSWMYSQPVHSSVLCIHHLLGLPWCGNPSMIFSRTVSANCPALPRVMWPKCCSFSFATLPINSFSRPNSVNIESFVRYSCHEMLSIFLQHHISKASILFLSDFFKVLPSIPYWNTAHTIDFITLTFVAVFIFLSFQILASTTAFCLAIAMRLLISLVQFPSADLYDPMNLKWCTCSNDSPSWSTCTEILSCLLTTIIFDFCALIYMLYCALSCTKSLKNFLILSGVLASNVVSSSLLLVFTCMWLLSHNCYVSVTGLLANARTVSTMPVLLLPSSECICNLHIFSEISVAFLLFLLLLL